MSPRSSRPRPSASPGPPSIPAAVPTARKSPVCARKVVASTVWIPAARVAVIAEFRFPGLYASLAAGPGRGPWQGSILSPPASAGPAQRYGTRRSFPSWLRRRSRWPRRPSRLPDPSGRPPRSLCMYSPTCRLPRWPPPLGPLAGPLAVGVHRGRPGGTAPSVSTDVQLAGVALLMSVQPPSGAPDSGRSCRVVLVYAPVSWSAGMEVAAPPNPGRTPYRVAIPFSSTLVTATITLVVSAAPSGSVAVTVTVWLDLVS